MKIVLAAVNAKFIHSSLAIRDLKAYAESHREYRGRQSGSRHGNVLETCGGRHGNVPETCDGRHGDTIIELAEYTINQQPDRVLADLYRRRPDVIAFSCYVWNMEYVGLLLSDLRQILPRAELWLGGPEVSYDAAEVLRNYPVLRGVMAGEGEITFTNLVNAYEAAGRSGSMLRLSGIRGIVYRSGRQTNAKEQLCSASEKSSEPDKDLTSNETATGSENLALYEKATAKSEAENEILINPPAEVPDLDEIPFFYAERDSAGEEILRQFEHRIIYYESSRGCPFRCSYCLSSIGKSVRFRDLELVKKELQFFLDEGVPQVKFVDRTFNCDHGHASAIWRYIRDHDNGVTNFHFEIEAELLTKEEIRLLSGMRPGLVQLEIGVQSTNPATLRAICRPQNVNHLRKIVSKIQAAGNIHQHLDLIAGLPEEDYESFAASFDAVYRMEPQQLQMGFLKLLKGSALHRNAEKFGIVCHERAPYEVIRTRWLSYDDILRLKGIEEMVEAYYNSWQFACTMRVLVERGRSPFRVYESLAAYYSEHHLTEIRLSRPERFEALLGFAAAFDPGSEKLYRELLVLDLYLRENSRSRPEWARDVSPYREFFRRYYRDVMNIRQDRRMVHGDLFLPETLIAAGLVSPESPELKSGAGMPLPVVFDYRKRDPLTDNARVIILTGYPDQGAAGSV